MHRTRVVMGDITRQQVDAVVNAANEWMLGGGGVDGAIHEAAGPELLEACRALPEVRPGVRCPVGEARITPAFGLPARFVIHTVGPVFRGGTQDEPELLASAYRSSLELAAAHGARSIAIPSISTGACGCPMLPASRIAVREVHAFLASRPEFGEVLLVAYDEGDASMLRRAVREAIAGRKN